jgi:hypothetical protein
MATITPELLKLLPSEFLAENVGQPLFNVSVAFIILQTFFFVLFVASRFTVRSASYGIETWCLIPAAYVLCIGHCINGIRKSCQTRFFAGKFWTMDLTKSPSPR